MGEENELLHTEEIKKRYHHVENEIKRSLTELLLLSRIGSDNYSTRGLSFTKDFSIRELTEEENPKYKSNPSTIKRETLYKTTEEFKNNILCLLNEQVEDEKIRQKYIDGIEDFFTHYLSQNITGNLLKMISKHKNSSLFLKYLIQTNSIPDEGKKTIGTKNICQQLAKLLFNRFGDEAFTVKIEQTHIQPPTGRNNYLKNSDGSYIIDGKNRYTTERICLSDKSLDYIFIIFSIANKVREDWGYKIDQVFHDNDFIRIIENRKATESYYIRALGYLLNSQKTLYYGKRGDIGQRERSRKTSQYADILRALTNNQLGIHNIKTSGNEVPEFTRDNTTKYLQRNGEDILTRTIKNGGYKFTLSNSRLKTISSCTQKIIEGKRINDIIGFRLSMNGISDFDYEDIREIGLSFITKINEVLTSNIDTGITSQTYNHDYYSSYNEASTFDIDTDITSQTHNHDYYSSYNEASTFDIDTDIAIPTYNHNNPSPYYYSAYNQSNNSDTRFHSDSNIPYIHIEKGQTIKIKNITIDNKGVLTKEQIEDICSAFNEIVPTSIRKKPESPYVDIDTWRKRLFEYYRDEIENDPKKLETLEAFYERIVNGKSRGSNGEYKDFKFNITFEIKNENDEIIGEKTMEIQFDDIRNLKGIEGHHMRDIERFTNTDSRLSFSQSLAYIRRRCEKALKWQLDELIIFCQKHNITSETIRKELFEIKFNNNFIKNIEDFIDRDPNNNKDLDETIIGTINYFLNKGTFILCFSPYINESQREAIKFKLETGKTIDFTDPAALEAYAYYSNQDANEKNVGASYFNPHIDKDLKESLKGTKQILTVDYLPKPELMENLHVCTIGELAAQQHSYLQRNRDVEVGINTKENRIGWISTGELIKYMNLGKKKDPQFYAEL